MDDLSGKSDQLNKKSESSDQHILPGDDAEKSSVETSFGKMVVSNYNASENGRNSVNRFSTNNRPTYSYGGRGRGNYNYSNRSNDYRSQPFGNPGRMPDRWEDYANIGEPIQGLPIVACRVPLNERLLSYNNVELEKWFTPKNLMERLPTLGCVIDLTATNRYYDPKVFTDCDVQHAKIHCVGHEIPDDITIQRFFSAMDNFLHDPRSRGRVIVVHCTHGLNRTGYLVARYLVVRRGYKPADAISVFNKARGYPIERENYLENLNQMIHEVCTNPVPLFQERKHEVHHQPEATYSTHRSGSTGSTYRNDSTGSAYRNDSTGSAYRRESTSSTYRRESTDSTYRRDSTASRNGREYTGSRYGRESMDPTYQRESNQQSRGHFGARPWNESNNYHGNYSRARPYADWRNRYEHPVPTEPLSNNETPNHRYDNRYRHQPATERTSAESRNYRQFENDLHNPYNMPQPDDHTRRVNKDVQRTSW